MPGSETKPTPASGMPAAMAATSVAKPSLDEISAPRSETGAILQAISALSSEVNTLRGEVSTQIKEQRRENNARFQHIEDRFDNLAKQTDTLSKQTDGLARQTANNTRLIGEQAESITRVASAAAKAADLALEAKQQVAKAPDETTKLVESALRIHGASLAATVDVAVTKAVEPLSEKVRILEDNAEKRQAMLTDTNQAVGAIVNELGIEDRTALGRDVKPGEKPPEPAFAKLDKRAKASTIVQAVIAIGFVAEALVRIFTHH